MIVKALIESIEQAIIDAKNNSQSGRGLYIN